MNHVIPRPRRTARGRRGSTYAFVLLTAASVAMLSVTAMLTQRLRTRAAERDSSGRMAQMLAVSAVEHALHRVETVRATEPDAGIWRATLKPQTFSAALDGGNIAWSVQNSKGDSMSIEASKVFYAVGVGTHGTASHAIRVAVRPSGPAFSSLEIPLFAKKSVVLGAGTVVQADGVVGANVSVDAVSSSVFADVESGGEIAGGTYHGATTTFAALRGMPDFHDVFDYYVANGIVIDESSLPSSFDDRFIEDVVVSPAVNPYGIESAEGIYVVDCGNKNLFIRNARIIGTLLLLDPGPLTAISDSVSWAAPSTSSPALLVKGGTGIAIGLSSADLVETARGVNFNPLGTPYEGDEDATLDDTYPSVIRGLVYTSQSITFRPSNNRIEGVVLAEKDIRTDPGTLINIRYERSLADDPPPGFFVPDGGVRVGAFSWERAPD